MKKILKMQISDAEEKLRLAMLDSDVDALNELLANELIFTNHLGQLFTKQDDINAHQSGIINLETITYSEQEIKFIDSNVAIVTVKVNIIGSYAGIKSDSDFRFTRVWHLSLSNVWQIVVAHSSVIS